MEINSSYIKVLVLAIFVLLLIGYVIYIRRKIIVARLAGHNLSKKNILYKIISKLFLSWKRIAQHRT